MRFLTLFFTTLMVLVLLGACTTNSPAGPALTQIDARLKTVDSLVLVFYKDPFGPDSIRYTRYYTQVSANSDADLTILQQQLKQGSEKKEQRNSCRGEGKIWCYTKGKITQTLYFTTVGKDCEKLYLIKDGFFYYSPIDAELVQWLQRWKPLASEPENGAVESDS